MTDETPAERYRKITAGIDEAAGDQRAKDRVAADQLERALGRYDERMRKVGERTALSRFAVDLHWESALESLWAESWMTVPPFPRPDPDADPARLDRYDREMSAAYDHLMSLITRSRFGFRR